MIFRILCVLIGCLFGNFQSSYILVRAFRGKDIRSVGSHNAGTMNTIANEGVRLGIATFLLDAAKTFLAAALCLYLFGGEDRALILGYACLGAALGHEFPFWLRFRGGKGVAVALAFLLMLDYRILLLAVAAGILAMLITRKLWLGSAAIAAAMSVGAFAFYSPEAGAVVTAQAALIIILHILNLPEVKSAKKR